MRFIRASACLAITALTACNNNLVTLSGLPAPTVPNPKNSRTFHLTGKAAPFTVPTGVTQIHVTVDGAQGGGSQGAVGPPGAFGAEISAEITVRPGQQLIVYVGGHGTIGGNGRAAGGGFNGGGNAFEKAYGGGGSSDVRTGPNLQDRILVAAGGGGTGETFKFLNGSQYWCYGGSDGLGGAAKGGQGSYGYCGGGNGGGGGSEVTGGAGGTGGPKGSASQGGYGNQPCKGAAGKPGRAGYGGAGAATCAGNGGGGGGGYYGGGGGGSGGCCNAYGGGAGGGGGGGSSYVEPNATQVQRATGAGPTGDGVVAFTW